ncbi:MAG: hypothetical protein KDD28_24885, partial [Phaeodactylibacter sp.]|nr:hypothetical protein [Phaeodactylibacter sp.]
MRSLFTFSQKQPRSFLRGREQLFGVSPPRQTAGGGVARQNVPRFWVIHFNIKKIVAKYPGKTINSHGIIRIGKTAFFCATSPLRLWVSGVFILYAGRGKNVTDFLKKVFHLTSIAPTRL